MDILSPIFNFVHAHPYIATALAISVVICLLVMLAECGKSGSGSSGGGSISTYTSTIAQTGTSAKTQMRTASDDYLRNVRNTIGRKS